jgi:putative ATP-binding cassette transporter
MQSPAAGASIRPLWANRRRFARALKIFLASEVGATAKMLFAALAGLLVAINGLNVVNSYVGREFMTAIANRDRHTFVVQALVYLVVFAISTVVAVMCRFSEERLGLLWREWLTRRLVATYLRDYTYYRLREAGEILNPDQRIAEDARAFTTSTLSLFLLLLNGTFTIFAFSGVMWSISPLLFFVAVGYAMLGSALTIAAGRPLIWLSYNQLDKEADFRAELIHIRENAESISTMRLENRLTTRLRRRIDDFAANAKHMIAVNRNLGFFTTGYNYLIQIIPALIIAPLYMRGEVEFGVITQSSMAFAHLLGAFSLIITQFQSISSYAAVLARLSALGEATEQGRSGSDIEIRDSESFAYDRLTLRSPRDGRILTRRLTLSVPHGRTLLVAGANETAKVALFRATAGIWRWGEGRILRPTHDRLFFLPERPYLAPGTLRELLAPADRREVPDEEIQETLRVLAVQVVSRRAGGLDVERDWDNILALGEQQLLAVARLLLARPRFAFLDRIATALTPPQLDTVLGILAERSITYVTVANDEELANRHDDLLVLENDGEWTYRPAKQTPLVTEPAPA